MSALPAPRLGHARLLLFWENSKYGLPVGCVQGATQ